MAEQKYWITPDGEVIKLSRMKVYEHFKFFNDTKVGRHLKKRYGVDVIFSPENLFLILEKGFIRVLELNEILNISYSAEKRDNPVPLAKETLASLYSFLNQESVNEVQFDCYVKGVCQSKIVPKTEFLGMLVL